ncbi:reverse transcriptase/maturase family protein [Engelhardtia mirabilis]|uniref:Reverse transcriptase (RNA-dependent DNA polymerase) n=1 Tax=Engelhardtia mirabilis TaxID=2528011 RepID=A0A518BRE3_9BACT|nr:Reverse transcriptase (RNA-dependent DNA polymerase) [Planctomycetes bacterium Pla133]QDV03862.1 Reverse transcriptase (RNA-dependent DNA polymerase) [Planctomycetes bacterium Pla86]
MTRTRGGHWDSIVSFENLLRATLRAARGKRRQRVVAEFLAERERRALALRADLRAGTWRPGEPKTFLIEDPKRRLISAAPFTDRVVHHALIDVLEPTLERRMVRHSFACRRGLGVHAALDHAQGLIRRHPWFLKLDVAQCFGSMRHDVVMGTLGRVLRGRRTLELCERIVAGPPSTAGSGRGLPIGNLTSQWFANLTLDRLDHYVLESIRVHGYARYMDDFVVVGPTKASLVTAHARIAGFLAEQLHLELKQRATILAPSSEGLPFLGWRLYPGLRRLRPQNLRRSLARLRRRRWELATGQISERGYIDGVRALCSHLGHGSTLTLRRSIFDRHSGVPVARAEGRPP